MRQNLIYTTIKRKIIKPSEIYSKLRQDFTKEKNTVLIGGCFDVFHFGHLSFLRNAKEDGTLIILLESDEFIKKNKHREPVHTQEERAEILASLVYVDWVIKLPFLSSDEDYFNLVKLINPNIIAVTKGDLFLEKKKKQAAKIGARIKVVCDKIEGLSSTNIINYFKNET